eukprot:2623102-Amphidinium_carterae.1
MLDTLAKPPALGEQRLAVFIKGADALPKKYRHRVLPTHPFRGIPSIASALVHVCSGESSRRVECLELCKFDFCRGRSLVVRSLTACVRVVLQMSASLSLAVQVFVPTRCSLCSQHGVQKKRQAVQTASEAVSKCRCCTMIEAREGKLRVDVAGWICYESTGEVVHLGEIAEGAVLSYAEGQAFISSNGTPTWLSNRLLHHVFWQNGSPIVCSRVDSTSTDFYSQMALESARSHVLSP